MNPNIVPTVGEWNREPSIYTLKDKIWSKGNLVSIINVTISWAKKNFVSATNNVKHFQIEALVFCLFLIIVLYVAYCYLQCQMKRLTFHVKLLQLHSGSTFIYNAENCPICLGEFKAPVRTSCGHAFCIFCLLSYFNQNSYQWKCICPLCRNLINSMECLHKFNFSKAEQQKIVKAEKQLRKMIERQNSDVSLVHGVVWLKDHQWKAATGMLIFTIIFAWIFIKFPCEEFA